MPNAITMPKYGQTMEEGTISSWLKKTGESMCKGEIIAQIEADKATMDLESEQDGVMLKIIAAVGETIACGAVIAYVGNEGETV